jgi:HlyD family secretion protein
VNLNTKKNKTMARGLATALLLAVGPAGCRRGDNTTPAQKAQQAAVKNQGLLVSVTPARSGSISDVADVTGALNALQDVTVGIKTAGKIVAVYAREGDVVRAGQVIAQQDTLDLQNQLDQQRANLLSAQTKLDQARVTYQNSRTNLNWTDQQTLSAVRLAQAGLDAAKEQAQVVKAGAREQERKQAEANLAAAKADLDQARSDLKRYQDLYRQQAVSAQQLDQAQAVADSAQARYNAQAQALSLIREGARPEDIRRAEAAVEQARQQLITAQSNRSQVSLRRADVETARVGITQAQAGVAQAQAAVRLAEKALSDTRIVSPIDGVVAERKVEPGMQVAATKPDVMRIVALESIYFDAQLSETQYAEVRMGQPVTINVDALPGHVFRGIVSKIYPVASSTARSFTVRISLKNDGNMLRPQMFARGQIVLATHPNAILIPRVAVLDYNGNSGRVFVNANGQAAERHIKTGFSNIRDIEVLPSDKPDETVKAGELVVTVGQAQIQNGDKLQITPENGAGTTQTAAGTTP